MTLKVSLIEQVNLKLVSLQKNNKSNKCSCVNYRKKDWSKFINKQYNKHEYRH